MWVFTVLAPVIKSSINVVHKELLHIWWISLTLWDMFGTNFIPLSVEISFW